MFSLVVVIKISGDSCLFFFGGVIRMIFFIFVVSVGMIFIKIDEGYVVVFSGIYMLVELSVVIFCFSIVLFFL